jgi:hypothetical protein
VSIANRKLLQCMSQLLALSVSSSAPEIRTLLEVKRTSGEAPWLRSSDANDP